MNVFKKHAGKRVGPKDKNYSKGTWYLWKRINGKPIQRALKGATTKEQAEAAARKIIDKAFNQRYGIRDTITTFDEFADGPYTDYYEQHNTNTANKKHYVKLLKDHFKNQLLTTITPQECRNLQVKLRRTYAASTVNEIMSTVSKIFTIAGQEGIVDRNPMQFVPKLEEPPPRNNLLTAEQKKNFWEQLESDRLMLRLVTLAVNLPLRRGQLLAIEPEDVDFENDWLAVIGSKKRKPRIVPLNFMARKTLEAMIADSELPFPLSDFRKRWKRITVAAGINDKDGKRGENFTFHDLRKEFASNLIKNNVNPELVRRLFAHSDMRITQVYMQPDMGELSEAINTLN